MARPLAAEAKGPGFKIPLAHLEIRLLTARLVPCHQVELFEPDDLGSNFTQTYGFNIVIKKLITLIKLCTFTYALASQAIHLFEIN